MSGKDDVFQTYISSAYMSGSAEDHVNGQANQNSSCSVHKLDENTGENVGMGMGVDAVAVAEQVHENNASPAANAYSATVVIEPHQICQFTESSGATHPLDAGRLLADNTSGSVTSEAHNHQDQQASEAGAAQHIPQAVSDNSQNEGHTDVHFDRSTAVAVAASLAARGADGSGLPEGVLLAGVLESQLDQKLIGTGDLSGVGGGFSPELVTVLNQLEVFVRGGPGREDEIRNGVLQVSMARERRTRELTHCPCVRNTRA
jgi:hypothetical protein